MPGSVGVIKKYFGLLPGQSLVDFKNDWGKLTDKDKEELTEGIKSETYTY